MVMLLFPNGIFYDFRAAIDYHDEKIEVTDDRTWITHFSLIDSLHIEQ